MRSAELISYHEEINDAASVPQRAATPANDQDSAIVRQTAGQAAPGNAVWRNLADSVGRNLGSALLALSSIALFIGAWYLAVKYRVDFYVRFTNIQQR